MAENRDNFLNDQFSIAPQTAIPPEQPIIPVERPLTIEDFVAAIKADDYPRALEILNVHRVNINQYDSNNLFPIHYLGMRRVSNELFDLIQNNTAAEDILGAVCPLIETELPTYHIIKPGDTVLHIVARCNDEEVVERFCAKFNYYQDITNNDDDTPLLDAISNSNIKIVNFALLHGAKVDEEITERAEDFLSTGDYDEEAENIYKILSLKIGKTPEEIDLKIKHMREVITKTSEEAELSDKDSADEPSTSPSSKYSEQAEQGSKKRKR